MAKFYIESDGLRAMVDCGDIVEGACRAIKRYLMIDLNPELGNLTIINESGFLGDFIFEDGELRREEIETRVLEIKDLNTHNIEYQTNRIYVLSTKELLKRIFPTLQLNPQKRKK